jgi:hypothetical protein
MSAINRWLKAAEAAYHEEDDGKLFERATRIKGDADHVIFTFQILQELRGIRAALEAQDRGKGRR